MAHKKAGGSSRNGRDSKSKRLGVKRYGGEFVSAGSMQVKTSASVAITPCSPPRPVLLCSANADRKSVATSALLPKQQKPD